MLVLGVDIAARKDGTKNCGLALMSTCDCPQTYGFDCVNHTCQWDYAP